MTNKSSLPGLFTAAALSTLPATANPLDVLSGNQDVFDPSPYSEQDLNETKKFAPASAGDSDLGEQFILKRYEDRTPIRFDFDSSLYWSNNISSFSANEQDGWFWANHLGLSWRPPLGHGFFFESYLQDDLYLYDSTGLDFNSIELGLGIVKILPDWGDLVIFGRYEVDHMEADLLFGLPDIDVDQHRLHFGVHKPIFTLPQHSAYIAADGIFTLDSDPSFLERDEFSLHLGYIWTPCERWSATTFYRVAWIDYDQIGRNDTFQSTGIELSHTISDSAEFRTSVLYGNNDSDVGFGFNDFEAFQVGLGGSLVFKW